MSLSLPVFSRRERLGRSVVISAASAALGIFTSQIPTLAQSDFATITQRVTAQDLTGLPSVSTVQGYMSSLNQSNGSWSDINYADTSATNWNPETHVDRLLNMTQLYASPGSSLYQNATLGADISLAYNYWISKNPTSSNWWYNDIGSLQPLGSTMVLFGSNFSSGQINSGLTFLARANAAIPTYGGGQNTIDLAIVGIDQAIASSNTSTMTTAFSEIGGTIAVTPGIGIQSDHSFQEHGPQLYIGGYGQLYDTDVLNTASLSAGTSYAITTAQEQLIVDQLLDGTQWFIRGQALDLTSTGRGDSRAGVSTSGTSYESAISSALSLGSYRSSELQAFLSRQQAAVASGQASSTQYTLSGNRNFFDSDIMVQQRPAYYESVKISSVRTSQTESGNGEGLTNLYMSDGVNQIMVTGKEYANIEPVWNWRMLPGTTVEQDTRSLKPTADWGVTGTATYAGGVSNGTDGAEAFNYNRYDVAAKKSWYFYDNEEVALGAAITSSNTSYPVYTTLNQCLLTSTITYETTGSTTPVNMSSGTVTPTNLKWVYQGGVGYFFINPVSNATIQAMTQTGSWYLINTSQSSTQVSQNVFTLFQNHGTAVSSGSYGYIVVPNISAAQMDSYAASNPIQVLANNSTVQATYQSNLNISQAAFYSAGSVTLANGGTMAANNQSMTMMQLHQNQLILSASSPTNTQMSLNVTLSGVNPSGATPATWFDAFGSGVATFNLPGGSIAGSTVGFTLTNDGNAAPTISITSNDQATNSKYTISAAVVLPNNTKLQTDSFSTLAFAGNVSGASSITIAGSGSVALATGSSYSGAINASSGTINIAGGNYFASQPISETNGSVELSNGGKLILAGNVASLITTPSSLPIQIGTGGGSINTAGFSTSIDAPIANVPGQTGALTKLGSGTLTLSAANSYTGATNIGGGTVVVSGSLNSASAIGFVGSGTISFNESAGTTQSLGALRLAAGDGTVQSVYGGSGNSGVTFSSLASRSAGAAVNLVLSNGTNGSTNQIRITGQTSGLINPGVFFNGRSYAWMNSAGTYVRGINYGTDTGTATSSGTTSLGSVAQQQITGNVTAQSTATFTTLNDAGNNNITIASGKTVTVSGILKSGNVAGGATISGGTSITAPANTDLVIRTDGPNDTLTISTPIVANGSSSLTKSGSGILTLLGANTYTGGLFVDGGTLQINASANFGNVASLLTINSATVEITGAVTTGRQMLLNSDSSTLQIDSGETLSMSNNSSGIGTLNKTGAGTLILSGTNSYTGGTKIVAGTIAFNSSTAFPTFTSLTVGNGSQAIASNHGIGSKNTLLASGLTIAGSSNAWTGLVDLSNNDLVVRNGDLSTITNQVSQGYNNASWQGSGGITSSAAASDSTHLTALGVIQNSVDGTPTGAVLYSTFDGTASNDGDVLTKYTRYGDANLDGIVDGSDYSRIDNGANLNLTGWFNGDFNYDGVINGSDYTLIDNAYNTQGAQISDEIASPTAQIAGAASVPEPATLTLAGLGFVGLLGRRKAHR